MPNILIQLDPATSPVDYEKQDKSLEGKVPDGTGLQILFDIAGETYVLSGPRGGSILTVLGGAIEEKHKSVSFLKQIQEEVFEESFGVLKLEANSNSYQLHVNDRAVYELEMCPNQTVMAYKPGKFAYVTFTARCKNMDLTTLKALSEHLSPTAHFWAKLGGFLIATIFNKSTPQDETFAAFWQGQREKLDAILADLTVQAQQLGANLLMTPTQAFGVATIEEAWNQVRNIATYKELQKMGKHTVGRFSERAGYFIFKASDLLIATENKANEVKDIFGNVVVPAGSAKPVFNEDAVSIAFPALGIAPIQKAIPTQSQATLSSLVGNWSTASTSTAQVEQQAAQTPAPF